jgi:hypothetical protein
VLQRLFPLASRFEKEPTHAATHAPHRHPGRVRGTSQLA